jgi:hypothetical protein
VRTFPYTFMEVLVFTSYPTAFIRCYPILILGYSYHSKSFTSLTLSLLS